MTSVFKKPAITALIVLSSVLFAGQAFAQADSTTANRALQGRPLVLLQNQERETPQVTNTTNVTQLVTQVVQPNTYQSSGSGSGWRVASAYADCGGATLLGGGGSCWAPQGFTVLATSQPNGNGWLAVCDTTKDQDNYASSYAICSY